MTKKDYIILAGMLRKQSLYDFKAKNEFIEELCDFLAHDNENFNKSIFVSACEYESCQNGTGRKCV